MAAFRFALQALLDHRTTVEAAQRQAFIAAEAAGAREDAKLEALAARLHESSRTFREDCAAVEAGDVRGALLEIDLVKSAIDAQRVVAGAARDAAAGAHKNYLAARAARQQVEAMRDRDHTAFVAEQDRREAADHDEANAQRSIISP